MINLLPDKTKKHLHHEYHMRLTVVALIALLIVLFVGNIILVPSVVLSSVRLSITEDQKEALENSETGQKRRDLSEVARVVNQKANFLQENGMERSPMNMTQILLESRDESVTLTTILYKKNGTGVSEGENENAQSTASFQVRGVASTRGDVIRFRDALQENEAFAEVVFPVSNLVADQNIEFTMELVVQGAQEEESEPSEE